MLKTTYPFGSLNGGNHENWTARPCALYLETICSSLKTPLTHFSSACVLTVETMALIILVQS